MNKDKDVAVFYNLKVHERLEIDNAEVLLSRDLDKIKALPRTDWKIAWMICSDFELKEFSNFYSLINNLELTSGFIHFYHEVPLKLYQWIKNNTFRDLVFESQAFMALQLLLYSEMDAMYERQLIKRIYLKVQDLKKTLCEVSINNNDFERFRELFEQHGLKDLEKSQQFNILKYWKLIINGLGRFPAEPFQKGYEFERLEAWGLRKTGGPDFHCKAYVIKTKDKEGFKKYRTTRRQDGYHYFDTHLKTWKELYEGTYHVDAKDFEFEIKTYNKPDYKKQLLCRKCYEELEFERNEIELDIPADNDYLCSGCFIKEYIEV